ncbi:hypothetical protein OG946_20190 [Streptomyces sp. NBC_01808]|uniref:hypothetical protein n=1 Tax=Streptomyces sp. NBC_01808 TaxID=2975947 RepID=UPI002DD7E5F4|nr:hypothetical protein [Streptomyces sp. NBC_01808]WSA39476.1 hypothetical protein OG946_20190 [Streptomyces sp. NBC_01808]
MSTPTPAAPAATAPTTPAPPAAPTAPGTPTAPAPTAAPAAPAAPAPVPAAPPAAPPAVPQAQDVASLPEWAQTLIRDTRAEAAGYRTRAAAAEQAQQPPAPAPAAPAAPTEAPEGDVSRLPRWAQAQVAAGQSAAQQLAMQSAVIQAAATAGADLPALLDSQSAMAALATVNPADGAAVQAAITAAMQANPRLSAQPSGPARGGVDFGGAGGGEVTPAQFAGMDYAARAALYQSDPDTYRRLAGS